MIAYEVQLTHTILELFLKYVFKKMEWFEEWLDVKMTSYYDL